MIGNLQDIVAHSLECILISIEKMWSPSRVSDPAITPKEQRNTDHKNTEQMSSRSSEDTDTPQQSERRKEEEEIRDLAESFEEDCQTDDECLESEEIDFEELNRMKQDELIEEDTEEELREVLDEISKGRTPPNAQKERRKKGPLRFTKPFYHTYFNRVAMCCCNDINFKERVLSLNTRFYPKICGYCRLRHAFKRFETIYLSSFPIKELITCTFENLNVTIPLLGMDSRSLYEGAPKTDVQGMVLQIRDYEKITYYLVGISMQNRIKLIPIDYDMTFHTSGVERVYFEKFVLNFNKRVRISENVGDVLMDIFTVPYSTIFFIKNINILEGSIFNGLYHVFRVVRRNKNGDARLCPGELKFSDCKRIIVRECVSSQTDYEKLYKFEFPDVAFINDLIYRQLEKCFANERLHHLRDCLRFEITGPGIEPFCAATPVYFVLRKDRGNQHDEDYNRNVRINQIFRNGGKQPVREQSVREQPGREQPGREQSVRESEDKEVRRVKTYSFRPYGPAVLSKSDDSDTVISERLFVEKKRAKVLNEVVFALVVMGGSLLLNLFVHLLRRRQSLRMKNV